MFEPEKLLHLRVTDLPTDGRSNRIRGCVVLDKDGAEVGWLPITRFYNCFSGAQIPGEMSITVLTESISVESVPV